MLTKLLKHFFGARSYIHQPSWCSVCGDEPCSFLPLSDLYRDNAHRYGFPYLEKCETLSLETYSCANCGASDRERLYALWIDQQIKDGVFDKYTRTIHFAPEAALSRKLKQFRIFDYLTADLEMEHVDYKVDMTNMLFDDESFSFFICSHVLEHVESDDKAIQELYRITKPGGFGILMAPVVIGLEKTLEESSAKDAADRWRLYGQSDHVRLYAHGDYVNKIRFYGFRVGELGKDYFGLKAFRALGLSRTSVLYIVTK